MIVLEIFYDFMRLYYREKKFYHLILLIFCQLIIFLECVIANGMIYKQRRSGIIHNWTKTVNPGYKYVESIAGGITWYMMETKDYLSSISFKLGNEKSKMVSFSGQIISSSLSIKEN